MGCPLTVTVGDDGSIDVKGNTCKIGDRYARREVTSPMRTVTSSVRIRGGAIERVSVKTASEIPKGKIFDCMKEISALEIDAPVRIGDVVIENCADTGVRVIATKNVDRK